MRSTLSRLFPVGLVIASVLLATGAMAAAGRDEAWKKVDDAVAKGLPQTALEALKPIIETAMKEQAYGEVARALARRVTLEATVQGGRPEEVITRLEQAIASAPPPVVPVLEALLANWYWSYFEVNRWRFLERTATAQAPGPDFTTWDLRRLFAEIDRVFTRALSRSAELKQTPIGDYRVLLGPAGLPDKYRPTLYDFIAHQALRFYTSGEQAGARPEDAFEVTTSSPIFSPASEFLEWRPENSDTSAPALKAIRLYQDLIRFHQPDADPVALLDVDLARLVWGDNVAVGDETEKEARYGAALKAFVDRWADHEVSALALERWARLRQRAGNLVEAHQLATRGRNAHPTSPGGRLCANLIADLETRSARIEAERVWNDPWPAIAVHYRNVTNVHFRVRAAKFEDSLQRRGAPPYSLRGAERQQWLAEPPLTAWSADLPPTTDFQEHQASVPAPTSLKPGYYHLIASHRPDFGEQDNQVSVTEFWVSTLALVVRPRAGRLEGFVLEANSGEPAAEATVEAWSMDQQGQFKPVPPVTTDTNGFFAFTDRRGQGAYRLRATHGDQQLSTATDQWWQDTVPTAQGARQTFFFTDRAIYRPGQTIQYKGICVLHAPDQANYRVLDGLEVGVVFRDPNGRELARRRHRCNEYGSFAGSFTAPREGLTGAMRLEVEGGPEGAAAVSVEEYKRPKFQVTLEPPKAAARLNETVALRGVATAYTGAATDGAQVRWRVVRNVQFPPWWGWFRGWWPQPRESQEIAHGTTTTGTDGAFAVEFVARPDRSVPEADEPTFQFTVTADVTDSAGETRSAERVLNAGYTALRLSARAGEWLVATQEISLAIESRTLDGEPQSAEGVLKVHRLRQPDKVPRAALGSPRRFPRGAAPAPPAADPNTWELGEVVVEQGFNAGGAGVTTNRFRLPAGPYRAVITSQDRFGRPVTALLPLMVLAPDAPKFGIKVPQHVALPKSAIEPGEEFVALWATGYDEGRAFIEIEHRHQLLERFWTQPGRTQHQVRKAVTEALRGGFTLHVTQVRENRAYLTSHHIEVPWSNKELDLAWEHFTSKLEPGQKETWSLVVRPTRPAANAPTAERFAAELAAALYDASLDQFVEHDWVRSFAGLFYRDGSTAQPGFANHAVQLAPFLGRWKTRRAEAVNLSYRDFEPAISGLHLGYARLVSRGARTQLMAGRAVAFSMALTDAAVPTAAPAAALAEPMEKMMVQEGEALALAEMAGAAGGQGAGAPRPNLAQVSARKNLNETAFFFPQLTTDSQGVVRLTFTMPEALTEWRFLGFAHDPALRAGFLEARTVTAKELMVQPNPPRFLREGDLLEFTVKVSNQSAARQTGTVRLTLTDAAGDRPIDRDLGNDRPELDFDIPAKESRSFAWRLRVPDGCPFLTYKAVASTGRLSDGEEGYLPVLARRIFLTESLPLPIRGPATKTFTFESLKQSGQSDTLQHQGVTVQMVSRPAWYAVMALPYLMEFPYECSEQTFNRLYANTLARHIASSDPKIRAIFDQWRNTPALDSPLEKNADLKSVALEETPWFRNAQNESAARRNVGILFDDNRLTYETTRALAKLTEQQLGDGAWPWFPGGPANDYITLYIVTGFGRLRHLGVDIAVDPAVRALARLDAWLVERHQRILEAKTADENHLDPTVALYLYGRSFFLKDQPIDASARAAVDYFLGQARQYWVKLPGRQSQGHVAVGLKRFGDTATPAEIVQSLRERSVSDEEMGRFWREDELIWWWYRAPIETQALMIEVFDEVAGDARTVEDLKVWLLKQKQTRDWKTTKATADAVYALLLRGTDLLSGDALVEVELGGVNVTPGIAKPGGTGTVPAVEPGTGFYERRFAAAEVKPEFGEITVKKVDAGVAWGSVHWQYFEDMTKVKPYAGTPLKLKKALYTKANTSSGPVLEPVAGPVKVGDELVVRIELRVDRDMEYVHLKDQRGSGTEPVNVLSQYRFQDGLAYYESTRDTASHFFIDYLPKGTYVFEYSTRVQHRGRYQTGVAAIQCLYAPEFNSHSEALTLEVQ